MVSHIKKLETGIDILTFPRKKKYRTMTWGPEKLFSSLTHVKILATGRAWPDGPSCRYAPDRIDDVVKAAESQNLSALQQVSIEHKL